MTRSSSYHQGELAVQQRAGVRGQAARLAGMLAPPNLTGPASRFLAQQRLIVLTARDLEGRLWTSPITGPPGFLTAHDAYLHVHALPAAGDPLAALAVGQPIGLLAIDLAQRRRMRINGALVGTIGHGLRVAVDQAYGNCPQYIQQRNLVYDPVDERAAAGPARRGGTLLPDHLRTISQADTFFLGTAHPDSGADASHRGGTPGFVRVDGPDLWWPDYPGNNMFNSLGNLAVDDAAALLFMDFATGSALYLSGTAAVEWTSPAALGDDGHTGRRIGFRPSQVVARSGTPTSAPPIAYPRNPKLSR